MQSYYFPTPLLRDTPVYFSPKAKSNQEKPKEAKRKQEDSGGTWRSQEKPEGALRNMEDPGGQEEHGGARRSQEDPRGLAPGFPLKGPQGPGPSPPLKGESGEARRNMVEPGGPRRSLE